MTHLKDSFDSFVPRKDSFRMLVSELAWSQGLSGYFSHQVPWQFSTGLQFAKKIMSIWASSITNQSLKSYHIAEFGAGSGLLSINILNHIMNDYPMLYDNICMHVTDASQSQIDIISKSPLVDMHRERMSFSACDIASDSFGSFMSDYSLDLIYFSNLIDSTPVHHILYEDGELYELYVKSYLPLNKQCLMVDTTSFPPVLFQSDHVKHMIDYDLEKTILFSKSIIPHIKERYKKVLINDSKLPIKMKAALLRFCKRKFRSRSVVFNIHPAVIEMIQLLFKYHPKVMIIGSDFGESRLNQFNNNKERLLVSYGAHTFSTVNFSFLSFYLKEHCIDMVVTNRSSGGMHFFSIAKQAQINKSMVLNQFRSLSETKDNESLHNIQLMIKDNVEPTVLDNYVDINHYVATLDIMIYLFKNESFDKAKRICQIMIKAYAHMAAPFYHALGYIYLMEGQRHESESIFLLSKSLYPLLPYPYHGLADISLMEGEQIQSLGLLTQSLIYMPESSKASFIDTCNQLIEASSSSSFFIK